ncbi:Zn-ribbon domain-containing OB-fold protein [Variovorax sp. PBL-E5]|uniref:Zn-ribbon domain-containing OB-fold protein n=1 Tax=Variovorax sp. PBL-E5 TaxID=434014 RepID=UPI001319792D|nr:Zn-ribbon domain-containing OB-fold protein [Variovorax sp. PBL-E5]VTU30320.1 putative nucleic-acid-binding protein containing a Zn-ribbon [Variovorax sp. PBL-E5]
MGLQRSLPETDGYAGAYWKAASKGQLLIQRCAACGKHQHYARPFCLACGERDPAWVPASGKGTVWSFTTVHRGPYEDLPTPYVVALVRLEEGVVLLSHIVDAKPDKVQCDQAVELLFQDFREGVRLPVFRLRESVR